MTAMAYLPATQCGYVWDDDAYVTENPLLVAPDGLWHIWFRIGATPQYYPMVHTSYWLEYRLWKLDPTGYHMVNILLHAVGAVLLWRVLMVLEIPGAWAAAAIFALHPVHVESVAWITERKNVLSGVFYISAALMYLRYALAPRDSVSHDRSGRFYRVSLVLFVCALLSKTVTCTFPAVLLLILWWKRKHLGWADVRDLARFFMFGIVLGLLTIWLEKGVVGAVGEEWNLSLLERCLVAGRVLCFYVGKLFWPEQLTFIYPRWHIDAGAWQQYLYPVTAISVIAAFWLARRRIGTGPLVAVLCFAGMLFPALGFFDVYPMRFSFVADHFQYLASTGIIVLVAAVGYLTATRLGGWGRGIAKIVVVFVLATLGTLTWHQCHIYKDSETLWRDTLWKNPGAWIAHNNLGIALEAQGKFDEAISHFRQVLEVKPDLAEAHNNLGNVLSTQGKFDEAVRHYRQALQIKPDYVSAHYNLGVAFKSQGKLDEAIKHYRQALYLKPDGLEMLTSMARILATHPDPKTRNTDEAIELAERAAGLTEYQDASILNTLATAYAAAGRFDQAMTTAQAALTLASAAQNEELVNHIRKQLELYKQAKP